MSNNNITVANTSLNIDLKVKLGVNQILRPVGEYNLTYPIVGASQAEQKLIRLLPNATYASNVEEVTQVLIVNTSTTLQFNAILSNQSVTNTIINSIYVTDTPIKSYSLTNTGLTTALIKINAYTTLIPLSGGLSYYGSALDSGIYDANFINQLTVAGQGIAANFTVNVLPLQYSWYAYPTSLGNANFQIGGFVGGYQLMSTSVNVGNVLYALYRSDNYGLGPITVTVF